MIHPKDGFLHFSRSSHSSMTARLSYVLKKLITTEILITQLKIQLSKINVTNSECLSLKALFILISQALSWHEMSPANSWQSQLVFILLLI